MSGRVAPGTAALGLFAAVVGVHAFTQVAVLASSVAGLRGDGPTAVATGIGGLVAGVWLGVASVRRSSPRNDSGAAARRPRFSTGLIWFVRVVTVMTVVWAAWLWARLWQLAQLRPPYDWDGLYYHLPALNAWIERGHVHWIDGMPDLPFVNYPMAVEAFTFFLYHLWPEVRLESALNLWYWPLGLFATVVIATRLGVRTPWCWLAGALVPGAPVLVSQSVTAYIDPAFAFSVMAAFAALLVFLFDAPHPSRTSSLLLGASLGLLAGAKGTGAPFALVVVACALAVTAMRPTIARRAGVTALLAAGVVAFATGGYWYVRNAVHAGNPLYPVQFSVGPLVLADGYDTAGLLDANLPPWLAEVPAPLRTPASWLQQDAPIHGYAPFGGLGYLWLLGGLPATAGVAAALWRQQRRRCSPPLAAGDVGAEGMAPCAFAVLFVLTLVLLLVQPASWWSRFTVWLHALGLPALGLVLQWLAYSERRMLRLGSAVLLVAAVGIAVWESERALRLEARTGLVAGAPRGAPTYLSTADALFRGLSTTPGFDRLLASNRVARSRWSRFGTLLGGALAVPLGARDVQVLSDQPTAAELDALQARGVEWIVWDEIAAGPLPPEVRRRAAEVHIWRQGDEMVIYLVRLPYGPALPPDR